MTNKEFFDFCYNQYRLEIEHGESVYRRGAFLLTSQAILGAMAYSLASCKYVNELFTRIDVFNYYACTSGALALVAISVIYMLKAVMPRPYPDIETMPEWVRWREKMLCHIASQPEDQKDTDSLFPQVIVRMAEAQKGWALKNEPRRQNIRSAILYASLALACIAGQGLFLFILRVRETINV
ncbi:MAG: hypothetical protein NTY65_00010 [Planctomycetota bacterium]|nr:hypothetical protein [Planctomycetota bacterium]